MGLQYVTRSHTFSLEVVLVVPRVLAEGAPLPLGALGRRRRLGVVPELLLAEAAAVLPGEPTPVGPAARSPLDPALLVVGVGVVAVTLVPLLAPGSHAVQLRVGARLRVPDPSQLRREHY